ncbi:MAG: FtsX-like permease family protein [Candidatus Eisenbacteria bacterium]|nr:FtsX-like permease family protein [Candidatus Latescibacterota bacterium]MBD3303029.1 FtsX-like permease family protein [Candidatus Eisenbacteria bacterium]
MRAVDLFRFSAGGLRGHRLRTGLSLLGVAIGVASVVLLTSLGEGARLYVTGEFASLGSNLLIVIPGKTETSGAAPFVGNAPNDLTVADADALQRTIPRIRRIAPISLGTAPASFAGRSRDVTVLGSTTALLHVRKLEMGIGRYLPPDVHDAPVCVIGAKIQRELFGNRNPLGELIRVGENRLRVIGVLAPRGTSLGLNLDEVVHVPVDTAMEMFDRTSLFRVLIEVRSHQEIEPVQEKVIATLKERHDGEEDVTVLTQDAVLSTFEQILGILTAALAGIAAISLTVAGIGIMNVMLVSISERTREIGLLKAVGVTRRQIVAIFLIEAAVISTSGGLIGLLIGIAGGKVLLTLVPDFPVQAPLWAVGAALVVSVSVGLLFGWIPSRRAARLDPIEALMRKRA